MSTPYQRALEAGYSEEEIQDYLSKSDPKFQEALSQGYSPEEVTEFLKTQSKPKESLSSNIGRQAGRTGARIAETVLGAPRALGEFGEMLIPEKALKKGAEKIGLKEPVEKGLEFVKKHAPYKLFPKTEDIRENITKRLFGEKLEPKTKWEKKADELVSDFAALAIPLPGKQLSLLKPGLLALGGNAASDVVGKMGGTEKEKTYAKLGTIVAGSMINPGSAQKLGKSLYAQAKEARPTDAKIGAKNLLKNSESFEKQLLKGDPGASSKKKSLDLIKEIKSKIKNDNIEIEELEQFKRDINEARSSLYETFKSDKVGKKSAKRNLDMVSNLVDKSLKEYGKVNPEWEAFYRPANEVHGAIAQSHKARNNIMRVAKKYGMHAILPALGIGHFGGGPGMAGIVGSAAAGTAIVGGLEIGARFAKSPVLQKHYINLINSALKDDIVAMHENLKRLEKELKKD